MRFTHLAVLALLAAPASVFAHGIEMTLDQTTIQAGHTRLGFILQTDDGSEVTDQDLLVMHEKKLHFQIYDAGLIEYRHVHPEYSTTESRWVVETDLPVDGRYRLWAEGMLLDGDEFTSGAKLLVQGGTQAHALPASLGDVRTGADQISIATLSDTVFRAGRMAMPKITLSRTDGALPVITPYLGAPAHVTATPLNGASLVHIHPMAISPDATELSLHMTFPKAGDYRVWVEFVEGGAYRLVPLSVTVLP